jgi:uncharacterized membrane protein (UPF0127 family)
MTDLSIEIADSAFDYELGLMFRKSLDPNSGMLFVMKSPQKMNFWGANTYIPLDIAFIDENKTITSIKKIIPLSLKSVNSPDNSLYALETNINFFKNNNITEGYKIEYSKNTLSFIPPKGQEVE